MKKITVYLFLVSVYLTGTGNAFAQDWEIPGTIVAGGNGYGTAANQLKGPVDVKADGEGNVYVADLGGHRIQKWAPGATEGVSVAGGIGSSSAANGLKFPAGIWLDEDNTMYISDSGNSRIQMWTEGATEGITVAGGNGGGAGLNQLNWPAGIFKKGNDLYIVDGDNYRVVKWTIGASEGVVVAGGNGSGTGLNQLGVLGSSGYLYVDELDNIYVTEYMNNRVTKWAPGASEGVVVADIGATGIAQSYVAGIWGLGGGKIVLSYSYWVVNQITVWEDGELIDTIVTTESVELAEPVGIFVGADYTLYVAESSGGGSNRVKKFDYICSLTASVDVANVTVCSGEDATLTLDSSEGDAIVNWYANQDATETVYSGGDFIVENVIESTSYWAEAYNTATGCVSERIQINITVVQAPAPVAVSVQEFEEGQTIADLVVEAEGELTWYADEALITELPETTLLNEVTYYVVQTIDGCTSEAIAIQANRVLGIDNINNPAITYYPNPVKEVINFTSQSVIESVAVFDISGRLVAREDSKKNSIEQMNLSGLSQGTYIVKIQSGRGQVVLKIIKE